MLYHLSWVPILFFVELYMYVPLYATIGFKQGKIKLKEKAKFAKEF